MKLESIIQQSVTSFISDFLQTAGEADVTNLYQMVIEEVDRATLEATMTYSKGNQSVATSTLTMSRATLRKKLQKYDLLYHGK